MDDFLDAVLDAGCTSKAHRDCRVVDGPIMAAAWRASELILEGRCR